MDALITFLTVFGGLMLSVTVAVAVEEFIFGQIFKIFFAPQKPLSGRPVLIRWTAQGQ
jgi:hypothetical protein